jgi:hypothetical protein
MGMRHSFAFLLLATSAFAQENIAAAPEYWPLTPGNQWVYRASFGEPLTVAVTGRETVGDVVYSVVTGLGESLLLRQDGHRLLRYDRAERTEKVYLDFGAPLDRSVPSFAHPCNGTAAIASRDARLRLPLGEFGLINVIYGSNVCADAGLTQDLFLPYVGLMRRVEGSLTGDRRYDLIYARINGVVMVATPETGFGVHASFDPKGWHVRMTLRHNQGEPLKLNFASGQVFDIEVKNEKGEAIYRWSADRTFLAALQTMEVSGERNWATVIPGTNRAGRYSVEAWLTTMDGVVFRASTALVVEVGIGN